MKRRFAISTRGAVPADLGERIAQFHAAAIEARERLVRPDPTVGSPERASRSPRSSRLHPKA